MSLWVSRVYTHDTQRGNGKPLGKNIERAEFRPTSAFCIVPMRMPLLPNQPGRDEVMLGGSYVCNGYFDGRYGRYGMGV